MAQNIKIEVSQSRLDENDQRLLQPMVTPSPIRYDGASSPADVVQMHIFDADENYITTVPNVRESGHNSIAFEQTALPSVAASSENPNVGLTQVLVHTNPQNEFDELGLPVGTYKVVYTFLKYYLSFGQEFEAIPWYIEEISTSRRELRIATPRQNVVGNTIRKDNLLVVRENLERNNPTGMFVLDLGRNRFEVIINQTVSGDHILVKLYKPLPSDINEKDAVIPFFEVARPVLETVSYTTAQSEERPLHNLAAKNTNALIYTLYRGGTDFQSWQDLLSTHPQTITEVLDHFLSSSDARPVVNIDYSKYTNFVHFSSAEERVRNFEYKLKLIEQYDATVGALSLSNASGSSTVSQSITFYADLKRKVTNGFDGYEKWLYYASGSTYSSSLGLGEVTQSTWPKSNSTYPYTLYSVTSSQAIAWFANECAIAEEYDNGNRHNLINTVPFHVLQDEENNESYFTFVQMLGQHFDVLWTYAKYMTQRYEPQHRLDEGAAKDVIYDTMKSFGFDLTNGRETTTLWKYAFGTDLTGSYANNTYKMSHEDATKEVWKRLFNNMPYLFKSKGTVRGIKALLTCYGIPSTMLRVREYGGPDADWEFESTKYAADEFTYQLNFDGTQIVSQSWSNPTSVEFRFYVDPSNRSAMTLLEADTVGATSTNLRLSVVPSYNSTTGIRFTSSFVDLRELTVDGGLSASVTASGAYVTSSGYLLLEVSGGGATQYALTGEIPVYNKQYWSVLLERTQTTSSNAYRLYVKQQRDSVIAYDTSVAVTLSGSVTNSWDASTEFKIGYSTLGRNPLIGSMQEFRLWNATLTEDVFNNHVLAPTAYNGNTYSSSFYDLALRWRMNQSEWYESGVYTTLILDSNPGNYVAHHGYWSGSNSASVFTSIAETNYYETPSIAYRRGASNKVRVDTYVSMSGHLSRTKRATVSRYDRAPLDSNRVGVYLSPTDIINDDIVRSFAGVQYDDFIGNPMDRYRSFYPDLEAVNRFYWSKYTSMPNVYTFLRVLDYFDRSLFTQIRRMLPARVEANVGYLIEPHLLERRRMAIVPEPRVERLMHSGTVDVEVLTNIYSYMLDYDGSGFSFGPSIVADFDAVSATASIDSVPLHSIYVYNILDMTVSNSTLYMNSGSQFVWSATGSQILPACDFWLDPLSRTPITASDGGVIGYSGSHYIYHRQRSTALENLWYNGCKQTVNTTPDRGLPFETMETTPNTLIVVDAAEDSPRLKVE